MLTVAVIIVLAYFRTSLWISVLTGAVLIFIWDALGGIGSIGITFVWLIFLAIAASISIPPLRQRLISYRAFDLFCKLMPTISETERSALEAGTTWWDAELLSGKPDWRMLMEHPVPGLGMEEDAFLEGATEKLCCMLNDWQITHENHDLPPEIWNFLKKHGFFGMIIPKDYGGLGFSAQAHSAVITKIASKSLTAAVTVMVPNSLGPGQLLINYGTDKQKDHYLPRLAKGKEIPCFALTSPHAGSDAASMLDTGVVCKGEIKGDKDVLGIRLNWSKRYITLAPVATLLGLAFKLYDPDGLLGEKKEYGITLALIPTDTAGVITGRRHMPLNQTFQNGPTEGKDVFVSIDAIIGGPEYAGQGWRMLMECLAEGRSISLPALSSGASKLASRATGAYARIRQQFKLPIGQFEGVAEALARIAGHTYAIDAVRQITSVAVDQGGRPAVISALAKYHSTERMRTVLNDAMDVFGGTAICLGPRNLLGRIYESIPISITVEGANILTRSLIVFGQGLIRCHPYLLQEMQAVQNTNHTEGIRAFDTAMLGHLGYAISNKVRAFMLALTGGRLARPSIQGPARRYAQHIERMSAALAFTADVTLAMLGGAMKRRESLSARLGDVLAQLYVASAAIKHFEDQGKPKGDVPLLNWVCEDALYTAQQQLDAFLRNFPNPFMAISLRLIIFPVGKPFSPPSDRLGHQLASLLLEPSETRNRLTAGIFINDDVNDPLGRIENALAKVVATSGINRKLRDAKKHSVITGEDDLALVQSAQQEGLITPKEIALLAEAKKAIDAAVAVDAFDPKDS